MKNLILIVFAFICYQGFSQCKTYRLDGKGDTLNCTDKNDLKQGKWISKIENAHRDFEVFIQSKPIKKVAYFIWANPYMVAGNNTFINQLLKLNNFLIQNLFI